jgi:lysozyme family protein/peptidoglycan hydrolase-like protein with peptidoglycan-binding domain
MGSGMSQNFESLKGEYGELWRRMEVRAEHAASVDRIARRLIGFKPRYEKVAQGTGVPWHMIAVLHQRESDANFATHLHNGDPLSARTRHVPPGRPEHGSPPFQWEESAIDALTMPDHALHLVKDWTIERACYEIEKYNGFGYRNNHPEVKSPYLWSFSTNYQRGKYVADGRFDASVVDKQCGTMPMLRRMMDLDPSVRFGGTAVTPIVVDPDTLTIGSIGERVRQLQNALSQLHFEVGEIDGEYGPITAAAVQAFQSAHGLSATGVADRDTQTAIEAALGTGGGVPSVRPEDVLQALFAALARAGATAPDGTPATDPNAIRNVLQLLLGASVGGQSAPGPTEALPASTAPILTPIDKLLGGDALAGKKTALAVIAYAVLAILQTAGVIGVTTPTGQIITILITAFGALGGVSKIDRVIQTLGIIAAKTPK